MATHRMLQIREQASDSSGGGQVEEGGRVWVGGSCDLTQAEGQVDAVGVAARPDVGTAVSVRRVLTCHRNVWISKRKKKHQPKC